MSRNKELVKNTLILTIGKICTQFITFLLLPLYTSILQTEEYGIIDLFNTCAILLVPIFSLQLDSGLFRFLIDIRDDKCKQIELTSTVLGANFIQTLIFVLLFGTFYFFVSVDYICFLLLDVVISIFMNMLLQFSRGIGDNKIYALGSFISALCTVSFNVILVLFLRMGIYGMLIATCLGKVLACIYLIIGLRIWEFIKICAFSKNLLKTVCRYSIPLIPNQLSWWIMGMSDRIVVSGFLGVSTNGIYAVANKFSALYITIYNIFHMAWIENVALHFGERDNEKYVEETINIVISLFFSFCLLAISFMPIVFEFFISDDYADAYFQIPILMLAALCQVICGLLSVVYIALERTKEIAKTSLYTSITNLVLDIGLISFIGLYAASVSTFIAYFAMAIYRYSDIKKYVKIKIYPKPLVMNFALGIIVIIAYYLSNSRLFMMIISSMLIIYFLIENKKIIKTVYSSIFRIEKYKKILFSKEKK